MGLVWQNDKILNYTVRNVTIFTEHEIPTDKNGLIKWLKENVVTARKLRSLNLRACKTYSFCLR